MPSMTPHDFARELMLCRPRLLRAAFSIVRDAGDAEDAVQDVSLRCYQHLADFRGEAALETWLYVAVRNRALELLRRRKARPQASSDALSDESIEPYRMVLSHEPSPEAQVLTEELRGACNDALQWLTPETRETFITQVEDPGRGQGQRAAALGVPLQTYKIRVWRARQELQRRLALKGFIKVRQGAPKAQAVPAGPWLWSQVQGARV